MKPKTLIRKYSGPAMLVLVGLLALTIATGCGMQTEQANTLVEEVNAISADVEPKFAEVEALLTQASTQLSAGQVDAEKASLTRAQEILDEILPQLRTAKEKTDEAASLEISDSYRQYLEAKARSIEASIKLTETTRELTGIYLADPTLEKPDTRTMVIELQTRINEHVAILNEAESEASRIAVENADEIEQ